MRADLAKARLLFWTFFKIGAFTFGGGYAMIPLIQREVAERRHWMEDSDILDIVAIAESTPEEEPERPAPAEDNDTYEVVEEMPKYPGGTEAMMAFIGQHLQYPSVSIENRVQGRVVVQFVIEKDGTPTDFKVIRNVDPYLDKEAIRVLSLMPKWTPGRQRGVPVKVRYTVPVTFRLQ